MIGAQFIKKCARCGRMTDDVLTYLYDCRSHFQGVHRWQVATDDEVRRYVWARHGDAAFVRRTGAMQIRVSAPVGAPVMNPFSAQTQRTEIILTFTADRTGPICCDGMIVAH
jgi:hypothetical protein